MAYNRWPQIKRTTQKQWKFVLANQGLAFQVLKRYNLTSEDTQEIYNSVCLPTMLGALSRWKPGKSAYSTYATCSMYREVARYLRSRHQDITRLRPVSTLVDARWMDTDDNPDLSTIILDKGECDDTGSEDREFIKTAMRVLNPRERKVIKMIFWKNMRLDEIGDKLGISKERSRQLKSGAFLKLREQIQTSLGEAIHGEIILHRSTMGNRKRERKVNNYPKGRGVVRQTERTEPLAAVG